HSPTTHLYHSLLFLYPPPSPTHTYTLSLHDALPISLIVEVRRTGQDCPGIATRIVRLKCRVWPNDRIISADSIDLSSHGGNTMTDRKSTRLNSSHLVISYAVFCLKKKKKKK